MSTPRPLRLVQPEGTKGCTDNFELLALARPFLWPCVPHSGPTEPPPFMHPRCPAGQLDCRVQLAFLIDPSDVIANCLLVSSRPVSSERRIIVTCWGRAGLGSRGRCKATLCDPFVLLRTFKLESEQRRVKSVFQHDAHHDRIVYEGSEPWRWKSYLHSLWAVWSFAMRVSLILTHPFLKKKARDKLKKKKKHARAPIFPRLASHNRCERRDEKGRFSLSAKCFSKVMFVRSVILLPRLKTLTE